MISIEIAKKSIVVLFKKYFDCDLQEKVGKNSGGEVIVHDAERVLHFLQERNRPGFPNIERSEQNERSRKNRNGFGQPQYGQHHAADFIEHERGGVFGTKALFGDQRKTVTQQAQCGKQR